ncbi:MAG TPA: CAP domain-containing protein, partial [Coleofasciculaceae cyanobacterium]
SMEQSVHQQINQYRQSRNLPPLTLNAQITEQARLHSADMASGRVPFSHNGFDGRVRAIARSISYRSAAENVAYNQGYSNPGEQAVQGWLKSTGHRQNIEGNYDLTGIGITKNAKGEYYFTQIFIKRR